MIGDTQNPVLRVAHNLIIASVTVLILATCAHSHDSLNSERAPNCYDAAREMVLKVSAEKNEDVRIPLAANLGFYFRDHKDCAQDSRVVDAVSNLLKDHSDGVRSGAAIALAYMGPPAKRAVPLLESC